MFHFPLKNFALIVTMSTLLAACGGGGGGSSSAGGESPPAGGGSTDTPADGGSTDGGSTDDGSTDGGSTDGGSTDGGSNDTTQVLAKIEIDTLSNTIVDEPKVQTLMTVTETNSDGEEIVSYEGYAGVEIRGASSQNFAKKSYGVETRNQDDSNLNTPLMGFPEENDWVFHGPYSDKSLMRNPLMFSIATDLGRYAPRWKHFSLSIDDEYKGVYVLLEKIKRDAFRVDISNLKVEDNEGEELSGGYILKIDKTVGEDPNNPGAGNYNDTISFTSDYRSEMGNKEHHFIYDTPKSEEITSAQKAYIQDYVHAFEDALKSDTFTDELSGYRNYIDVDSFVDYFVMGELGRNVDGYRLSTYLVKNKNEKLAMGPMWDLNLAFGNADYCDGGDVTGWAYQFNASCPSDNNPVPFWWGRLLEDPYFSNKVKARWQSLRLGSLADDALETKIDGFATQLEDSGSVDLNFDTWDILGRYLWPNAYVGDTYAEEVLYLKNWLKQRTEWLDDNIASM